MSSIFQSLSDLVVSIFEVVSSIFKTVFDLFYNAIAMVGHLFAGILNMALEFFRGIIELAGGIGKFLLGNILVIGVLVAAFFGFTEYQRRQGRTVKVGDKKLN